MPSEVNILPDHIKSILAKYYDGLTTIEEERFLRDYFGNNQIPESNLSDLALLSFENDKDLYVIPNNELWESIRAKDNRVNKRRNTVRFIVSIAASFLIVFSLSAGYYLYISKQNKLVADSFNNPDEAYKVVQKYLGLVSSKLSYAYTEMKPIEKLSIPSETIQSFSNIDESFQRLKQLDMLNSSTRQIERFSILGDLVVDNKN